MPYLICPGCSLTVYSAAPHSTNARCTECEHPLKGAEPSPELYRRWSLADLRFKAREPQRGTE